VTEEEIEEAKLEFLKVCYGGYHLCTSGLSEEEIIQKGYEAHGVQYPPEGILFFRRILISGS
jgi:hypothetical protein